MKKKFKDLSKKLNKKLWGSTLTDVGFQRSELVCRQLIYIIPLGANFVYLLVLYFSSLISTQSEPSFLKLNKENYLIDF